MVSIAASILAADFSRLGDEVTAAERAGADWIHIDVMDGLFVPNLTMGPAIVAAVRRWTSLPIDVHLLIANPDLFIERFVEAGATHISVHAEAVTHLVRSLELIRGSGAHPGIALGPPAPLSLIEWSLDHADYVDILAVNPGFGGQNLIPSVFAKIRALRNEITRRGLGTIIQSDGGINTETIGEFASAGVGSFVVGSAFFGGEDYGAVVAALRKKAVSGTAAVR
ncbi:MAG: ribulose-phosphate 3-epimerase [Treponema sp. GWC1_61_84]|nr:MAG: ribulose-phosphate 3-epimerase [Treponema sp. GWC1_61_84]